MRYLGFSILLICCIYLASPFYNSERFLAAVNGDDQTILMQHVDLKRFSPALKQQFVKQAKAQFGGERAVEQHMMLQLGLRGMTTLIEVMLPKYLSPNGFRVLIHSPEFEQSLKNIVLSEKAPTVKWKTVAFSRFIGFNRFKLQFDSGVILYFDFTREGWRLESVRLPVTVQPKKEQRS